MINNNEVTHLKMDLYRYYVLLKDIARNSQLALKQSPEEQRIALEEIADMAESQVLAYERTYNR